MIQLWLLAWNTPSRMSLPHPHVQEIPRTENKWGNPPFFDVWTHCAQPGPMEEWHLRTLSAKGKASGMAKDKDFLAPVTSPVPPSRLFRFCSWMTRTPGYILLAWELVPFQGGQGEAERGAEHSRLGGGRLKAQGDSHPRLVSGGLEKVDLHSTRLICRVAPESLEGSWLTCRVPLVCRGICCKTPSGCPKPHIVIINPVYFLPYRSMMKFDL